jgi:hypothetical protein
MILVDILGIKFSTFNQSGVDNFVKVETHAWASCGILYPVYCKEVMASESVADGGLDTKDGKHLTCTIKSIWRSVFFLRTLVLKNLSQQHTLPSAAAGS